MTRAEQEDRIRQMLGRLKDAKCQGPLSELHDAHDSRLLMFPLSYTPAFRELDRCLGALRMAEPAMCRHVVSWYVDVEYRQRPVYPRKARGKGWEVTVTGYRLEPSRRRDADYQQAERGIPWLAREYRWDAVHLSLILDAAGDMASPEIQVGRTRLSTKG